MAPFAGAGNLSRDFLVHGLTLRVAGDLPVALEPSQSPSFDVLVLPLDRPPWHGSALDAGRCFIESDPGDRDAVVRDAGWVTTGEGMRIRYVEGATFWVSGALDVIWFEYEAPLAWVDAVHFLLEPVLSFVLRRRGTLVLHASAVDFGGRAVAFCGPAGTGKSSTAAACVAAGAALLSDDVVALGQPQAPGDSWVAHRGTSTIRLWDDGAAAFVSDVASLPPFSETWSKRVLGPQSLVASGGSAGTARDHAAAAQLALICMLDRGSEGEPHAESLRGQAALRALLPNTVAAFLHDAPRRAEELVQLAALVEAVPVVRLSSPPGAAALRSVARYVQRIAARHAGG